MSNAPEKLKIHINFQFESLKGKGRFGVPGIDENIKINMMN
jgi:hypothetical protein